MSQVDLLPFQRKSAKWLIETPRAILASDAGTGKTVVSIRAARFILKGEDGLKTFIVCPKSVKLMWQAHIDEWDAPGKAQVVHSKKTPLDSTKSYYIFSYDIFTGYKYQLDAPAVFIVDEAHNCKTPDIKRTQLLIGKSAISNRALRTWLLTATPFPKHIADSWTLFNFCSKGQFGTYWQFAEKFAYVEDTLWGRKAWGKKKHLLPELVRLVKPFVRRDLLEEHVQELPPGTDVVIPLEQTKEVKAIDASLEAIREKIDAAEEEGLSPWSVLNKEEIGALGRARQALGILKIPDASELIKNLLDQGQQVVVFVHHNEVALKLRDALEPHQAEVIIGSTAAGTRQRHILEFQGGQIPCLILSILAAGTGITLTAAHTAVFVEEYWTPASLEQAKARIRRIGQKWPCTYYFLLYKGTLDESVHKCARSRAKDIQDFWDVFQGKDTSEEIVWD